MKSSFKNLFGDDEDLKKETKVKVEWEPIKLQTEEQKPVVRKSGLKSLKESLGIEDKPKEEPVEVSVPVLDIPIKLPVLTEIVEEKEEPAEEIKEEVFIAPEPELPKSVIQKAAEYIAKEAKVNESLYQNPNPPNVDGNFDAVTKKLKQLETWVGRIASHGPGGGDANPHDVIEFLDRGVRFTPTPRMMYWNNTEDCVNITQADGSSLQVGLENYIRVYNDTGNTLSNGTFVGFTGSKGGVATVRPYVNTVDNQPLYSVGVLTTDVSDNTYGRATVLGMVRDIDTTGNAVGESWAVGDILWASTDYDGKFTKFKPTSPNVAISVAAVTTVDATVGEILVRPAIWPRFYSGDFFSNQTQIAPNANFAHKVTFSNTLFTSGIIRTGNTFSVVESGLYRFDVRMQLSSTNASQKSLVSWFKKNNENVPFSSARKSTSDNGGYLILKFAQAISLDPTDNVEIFYAVTDTSITIDSPAPINGEANIASVQLLVTQPSL